jgi:hypothetical protein
MNNWPGDKRRPYPLLGAGCRRLEEVGQPHDSALGPSGYRPRLSDNVPGAKRCPPKAITKRAGEAGGAQVLRNLPAGESHLPVGLLRATTMAGHESR